MKEFNYERCWTEYIKPMFEELYPQIKEAYDETLKNVSNINQERCSHAVTGVSEYLKGLFQKIPTGNLAKASQIVYYYGHFAPNRSAQEGGLYWKFQIIADTVLIKHGQNVLEKMHVAKTTVNRELNKYNDHKKGTDYDNEEVPELIKSLSPNIGVGVIQIIKVEYVNHKPDIFCISSEHMRKSSGMYLDLTVAPCHTCKRSYSEHTYERAIFIKLLVKKTDKIKNILLKIENLCKEHKIKIDGFVFVK